jgi:uncharacterized membrane protein YdbT with pleckstrin-like domain
MSYLERVLRPNEKVLHRASLHWILYFAPTIFLLFVPVGAIMPVRWGSESAGLAGTFIAVGILLGVPMFISAWIKRWTTEIAITDFRVIYKVGLIRRRTVEMNQAKIESVDVNQSILGRILDYGTVTVRGTGSSIEPLSLVRDPLKLRNFITTRGSEPI